MARADRSMWAAADAVATLFTCAAVTARARMFDHPSVLMRVLAERDGLHAEVAMLER